MTWVPRAPAVAAAPYGVAATWQRRPRNCDESQIRPKEEHWLRKTSPCPSSSFPERFLCGSREGLAGDQEVRRGADRLDRYQPPHLSPRVQHGGRDYVAEVGQTEPRTGEPVLVILGP